MNKYKMVLEHGCGDNSCYFVKPKGMATNGGCRCLQNLGGGRSHSSFLILSVELLSLLTEENKKLRQALGSIENMSDSHSVMTKQEINLWVYNFLMGVDNE